MTEVIKVGKRLGRKPRISDERALLMGTFLRAQQPAPPEATEFWRNRSPFALRTFSNDRYSDCTIAKQAIAAMRMERLEVRRTPTIADAEVDRVVSEVLAGLPEA